MRGFEEGPAPSSKPGGAKKVPKINEREKKQYASAASLYRPKPPYLKNFVLAFLVGGSICMVGQVFQQLLVAQGLNDVDAGARVATVMIFIGALLTGIGVYDVIGKYGGAGSAIPISGFANSVVSPAMEFAREGFVLGMGAQMFVVAGPVIVYGVCSAIVMAGLRVLVLN